MNCHTVKFILVYHAKGDLFSKIGDLTHKIISPGTYKCDLCAITHGHFRKKKEWRQFLNQHEENIDVHHSDEFNELYNYCIDSLPVILKKDKNIESLIGSTELKTMNTSELISRLKEEIEGL